MENNNRIENEIEVQVKKESKSLPEYAKKIAELKGKKGESDNERSKFISELLGKSTIGRKGESDNERR